MSDSLSAADSSGSNGDTDAAVVAVCVTFLILMIAIAVVLRRIHFFKQTETVVNDSAHSPIEVTPTFGDVIPAKEKKAAAAPQHKPPQAEWQTASL